MKKIIAAAILIAIASGCATSQTDPVQTALSALAVAKPQYADAAATSAKILAKKSASTSTDTLVIPAGFERKDVYRYKGAPCEAADLTHDIVLIRTLIGAEVFVPTVSVTADTTAAAEEIVAQDQAKIDELVALLEAAAKKAESEKVK